MHARESKNQGHEVAGTGRCACMVTHICSAKDHRTASQLAGAKLVNLANLVDHLVRHVLLELRLLLRHGRQDANPGRHGPLAMKARSIEGATLAS